MSEAASQYYAQIANNHGAELPPVLSGAQIQLGLPEERISVRAAASPHVEYDYKHVLQAVGAFVANPSAEPICIGKAARQMYEDEGEYYWTGEANNWRNAYDRDLDLHVSGLLRRERLIPKTNGRGINIVTGYIKDARVEAVTPTDLPARMRARAQKKLAGVDVESDTGVLLVESAQLVLGRSLGRVASLTVVSPNPNTTHGYEFNGMAFNKNELLAASGLWQSAAIATFLDECNAQVPIVQNVRRGKSDRGRGGQR